MCIKNSQRENIGLMHGRLCCDTFILVWDRLDDMTANERGRVVRTTRVDDGADDGAANIESTRWSNQNRSGLYVLSESTFDALDLDSLYLTVYL